MFRWTALLMTLFLPGLSTAAQGQAHSQAIYAVAFSPDGRQIATSSSDRTVKLWDMEAEKHLFTLPGHGKSDFSTRLAFSADGAMLASSGSDGTIRLYSLKSKKLQRIIHAGTSHVSDVAFSPNGKYLIRSGYDNLVKLWNPTTGRLVRTLRGMRSDVICVAVSKDNKTVAAGGIDRTVRLWDMASGKLRHTLRAKTWVHSVAFRPDGGEVVGISATGAMQFWNTKTGLPATEREPTPGILQPIEVSRDLKLLACTNRSDELLIWEIWSDEPRHALSAHRGMITDLAFSPNGRHLASVGYDKAIRVWDTVTGLMVMEIK
jgi:WD40 repeat protein